MAFLAACIATAPQNTPGVGAFVTANQRVEVSIIPAQGAQDVSWLGSIVEKLGGDARVARECGRGAEGSRAS
mgnify:CR=1 FL=1